MKNISLRLPDELDAKLEAIAKKKGYSKSSLIREVLTNTYNDSDVEALSCYDLSRDIIGIVDGAEDLSYSKKHMKEYGK